LEFYPESRFLLSSLSVYIRQANYAKLRKAAEKNAKTIGQIINRLIEEM
jgi:hypothetical protein